jgi:hypothetical protein
MGEADMSRQMEPHLPTVYVTRMAKQHPGCWREVDELRTRRGRNLPDWPPWCFLPLAGAYAIVSKWQHLTPAAAAEIGSFGALSAWRVTQGIYEIHPAMRAAIEETPLEGDLPTDVLHALPEWCIYVRTPGMRYLGAEAAGFFAFLEWDVNTGREELRLVADCSPALHSLAPIHLGGTIEEGIARAAEEAGRQIAAHPEMATALRGLPSAEAIAATVRPMVNLVLYVCARNAEIRDASGQREKPTRPTPTKTASGPRLFPAAHPTVWAVGWRTGAALDAAGSSSSEPQGGTHAGPRAHVRRAHWHSFWTGPRDGARELVLRWLSPVLVGGEVIVPTVRPIE